MASEPILRLAVLLLVAQIPFESAYTWLGLTNLQWTFLLVAVSGAPILVKNWNRLASDRLVQAAALFISIQWMAAAFAPEFHTNAVKGAIRFTVGLAILVLFRCLTDRGPLYRIWAIASGLAAAYALADYAGLGVPWFFRDQEFYLGQVRRLSGSFEYPNTAAAYYAVSLPLVYWSSLRSLLKWVIIFMLWTALILTFSQGALVAVVLVLLAGGWQAALKMLGTGVAAYAILIPLNPYMFERIQSPAQNPTGAEYKIPWNKLHQQPGVADQIPIEIRNTGISTWRPAGLWHVGIAYRWLDTETEKFSDAPVLVTALPHNVSAGHSADVLVRFRTPPVPGKYLLAIELFSRDFDWFSRTGVRPALILADIEPSGAREVGVADLSSWYQRDEDERALTASVNRASLWRAALEMFKAHPFGVGPDNYRLQYGKYLGARRWDTHVYSNNLYLEILTGSGILGLAAFALMLATLRWRLEAGPLILAVFLVHGIVDVFLMTTPIYFAFWISLANVFPSSQRRGMLLLRVAPGRNELFGMLAPERRRIDERNTGPGDDGFRGLEGDSHVRPLRHAPHLIDVHFFNEPSGCKPIVQAWILSLEEQFVLVSR